MNTLLLVAFLAGSVLSVPLAAKPVPAKAAPGWEQGSRLPRTVPIPLSGDGLRATVHRLKNGLTVYLSPNHETPRISAWIAVRAGARSDPSDSTGMAHYLEHMFFKGSSRLGTLDFGKEKTHLDAISRLYEENFVATDTAKSKDIYGRIDQENAAAAAFAIPNELDKTYKQLGFRGINAFTSNEMTVYVTDMPKNRFAAWAKLESDRFQSPVFRLFQTEIETVYEEKNRSLDNPGRILNDALIGALYGEHPYGRTVLGSIEHLKNPSLAKMYEFQRKNYVPNNMAIALAGDFEPKEALRLLESRFGGWEPKPVAALEAYAVPKPTATVRVTVQYESEEQVVLAWPVPPRSHPDHDPLVVMDMVMDNSESGIVNLTLNQAQKVKLAGSGADLKNEGGAWQLWAVTKDSQTLEEAEALLLGTVERLKAGEFSEDDLKAIITNFEIAEKRKLESNEARVGEMAYSFVRFEEWEDAAGRLERLKKISKDDVLRVARQYLGPGKVAAYRRKGKPEVPSMPKPGFTKIDIARGRESAFYKELVSMPAKPIEPKWLQEGRDYRTVPTPWGRIVAAKNPFNDLFHLTFWFERGSRHEKSLCAAFDLLGLSGAGDMSADAFKKKLYSLGTTMNTGCGEQTSMVSLGGLEQNLEESLRLLRLRFAEPNIAGDTLKKMVEVKIGAHKDNKLNPNYVGLALGEWAGRGQDSAVLNELSDAELKDLDEGKLKEILNGVFGFRYRAGYMGLRTPEAVRDLLAVPGKSYAATPERRPLRYRRPGKAEVLFTHRDMVQSQVGLLAADEVYDPARHVDYYFYSDYMGGGMSSVIFQEVREARAMAYTARGGYMSPDHKGDETRLWGWLGTQADKTVDASVLLKDLLTKLPPSGDRFRETKRGIEETYRTSPVEFRGIPGTVCTWEDMGFAQDPRPERFRKALAYTLDDLRKFAARFEAVPKIMHILGNRSRVDLEGLKKLGEVSEKPLDELFPY